MQNKLWLVLGVAVLMAATSASAQVWIEADIPFDFTAGKTLMPAGEYRLEHDRINGLLFIRSKDRPVPAFVSTFVAQAGDTMETSQVVFNRYGDSYFLSQVWSPGSSTGRVIKRSHTEREMARDTSLVQIASVQASNP